MKRQKAQGCRIHYARRPEFETAEDKLTFLGNSSLHSFHVETIKPKPGGVWINEAENDFDTLVPVVSKATMAALSASKERAIFKLFSLGISTNRDEWVTDGDPVSLRKKMRYFVEQYESTRSARDGTDNLKIKWSRNLKRRFAQGRVEKFDKAAVVPMYRRPFLHEWMYNTRLYIDERGGFDRAFPSAVRGENVYIAFHCISSSNELCCLIGDAAPDLNMLKRGNGGTFYLPYKRLDEGGVRGDNITDWALDQFKKHCQAGRGKPKRPITKEAIFHYVYGVLHDPVYREKYALNLKREFPRIPFYDDFWQWEDWGKELMDLHIGYEQVAPAKLKRTDIFDEKSRKAGVAPKAMLKADKDTGRIVLDSETSLSGVPREAWDYRLGNRSALEWILDQYKEKKPKDPTIREKFDVYRFADYKEKVIDLLMRVTTVSVRTVVIVNSMKQAAR